ncbi:hypothetical protein SUGI_0440420 [Cryptomeria japonica]|nr:hypothetical protein SUGI_0440420 [Cryptomeria japonica]
MQGWVLLTVQAHFPSLKPLACDMGSAYKAGICKQVEGGQTIILYTGLYVMALGVGGIKGSLPVHGVEQFDENDGKERKLISNFFNWFFYSISIALVLAFFLSYTLYAKLTHCLRSNNSLFA